MSKDLSIKRRPYRSKKPANLAELSKTCSVQEIAKMRGVQYNTVYDWLMSESLTAIRRCPTCGESHNDYPNKPTSRSPCLKCRAVQKVETGKEICDGCGCFMRIKMRQENKRYCTPCAEMTVPPISVQVIGVATIGMKYYSQGFCVDWREHE